MRHDGLRGEEMVAEIDRLILVPIVRLDGFEIVPVVARRIVDEDANAAEQACRFFHGRAQGGDVAQIDPSIMGKVLDLAFPLRDQRAAFRLGDVEEGDACALGGKGAHQRRADARAAAGDEHALSCKVRIPAGHRNPPRMFQYVEPSLIIRNYSARMRTLSSKRGLR